MERVNLQGSWNFCLDQEKEGIREKYYSKVFADTIVLPTTVSEAKKGSLAMNKSLSHLSDPYYFKGYSWYSKEIEFDDVANKEFFLVMERTRISHLFIDTVYVGSVNSLCTSHKYRLTPYITNTKHRLTIMIDNTSYPINGGHMTSPDTQTNWNGITGNFYIEICNQIYIEDIQIYPDRKNRYISVKLNLKGEKNHRVKVYVSDADKILHVSEYDLIEGDNEFTYHMEEDVTGWSEHTPKLYTLHVDEQAIDFGFRDFLAAGSHFEINGHKTFLRGKHDGLLFPMTGYPPTDLDRWLKVLQTAKDYGINHYRFHTCIPPRAAFMAADRLGIYMEPEVPFWGTVTVTGEEGHDEEARQYLIQEGYGILKEFGNHPSFVMMSLGNELWGDKESLNNILAMYKKEDSRHLYTQGSNNFQFMPCILEKEDFYCGVRFSKDRLFRGSYAMCDAPLGHIQAQPPNANYNYDSLIRPDRIGEDTTVGGETSIQYGDGVKTVLMEAADEIIPRIPVISHEIGQYAMYPDFTEIEKYSGVLKAYNLEGFQEKLHKKNMLPMSNQFFKASGRFVADCYKAEIETALRSKELAGFQLLDLQDFMGQGTALVGILNAFMENKGVISNKEWTQFCNDRVLLMELPKHIFSSGESLYADIKLAIYTKEPMINPIISVSLCKEESTIFIKESSITGIYGNGLYNLTNVTIKMPQVIIPECFSLSVSIKEYLVCNNYKVWIYPKETPKIVDKNIIITSDFEMVCKSLIEGAKVLYYPEQLDETNSLEGTYCTDFWCYPMFRSISESMNKPVPVGTHGLLIEHSHPAFRYFPTDFYSTPQWYDIVSHGRPLILDSIKIEPIVWTIDNFERNYRLGNLLELSIGKGKLFICTVNLKKVHDNLPAKWLEYSIFNYLGTNEFDPKFETTIETLRDILYPTKSTN